MRQDSSVRMEINLNVQLESLIKGCKKRDEECQKRLFKLYYGRMMGICLRYCNSHADAQDVVQEGFIKLFDKIDLYNEKGSFEGWMRRLFVNRALDYLRRNNLKMMSIDNEDYFFEPKAEEAELDQGITEMISPEKLIEEIQNLSPVYRTVLNLYIYEGYTHDEIAEELGISAGTSKSNLSKAKRNLKKALSKHLETKYAS